MAKSKSLSVFDRNECVDDWLVIENDELRQQVEEMELMVHTSYEKKAKAEQQMRKMNSGLERHRKKVYREAKFEAYSENQALIKKTVINADLVDEYQSILDQYISLTGTKLLTDKLHTLREQGGYPEL